MMDGLLCALELDVVRKCGSEAVRTVRRSPFERGRRFRYGRTAGVVWRGLCAIRVGCGCRREQVVGGALAQRREGGQRGRAERQALEMAWSRNGDGRCRSERHLWRACDAGRMGMVVDGSSAWSRLWPLYLDAVCVCVGLGRKQQLLADARVPFLAVASDVGGFSAARAFKMKFVLAFHNRRGARHGSLPARRIYLPPTRLFHRAQLQRPWNAIRQLAQADLDL